MLTYKFLNHVLHSKDNVLHILLLGTIEN